MSSRIVNATHDPLPRISLERDDRWKVALRVAASPEFSKSTRLRNFLLYVCEKALTNRSDEIREQVIGFDVFDRGPGYNPGDDNIVRVEARELRKRLDRYFEGEGAEELFRINIPKGSYVPVFEPLDHFTAADASAPAQPEKQHASMRLPPAGESGRGWIFPRIRRNTALLLLGMVALIAIAGWVMRGAWLPPLALGDSVPSLTPSTGIWPLLFPSRSPLNIVVADSSLVLVQGITGKIVPLEDYVSGRYPDNLRNAEASMIAPRPYTDLADVMVTSKILRLVQPQRWRTMVRYPHDLTIRNLENDNLVFLGSAYSDPWVHEFDTQMNFNVEMDWSTGSLCFQDNTPQAGALTRYCAGRQSNHTSVTYGLVSLLPNLQHTGNVLILEGTTGAGTEAAGDFVTNPHYALNLRQYLGLKSKSGSLPYFQLLFRTVVLDNAPGDLTVISHKLIGNPRK